MSRIIRATFVATANRVSSVSPRVMPKNSSPPKRAKRTRNIPGVARRVPHNGGLFGLLPFRCNLGLVLFAQDDVSRPLRFPWGDELLFFQNDQRCAHVVIWRFYIFGHVAVKMQ